MLVSNPLLLRLLKASSPPIQQEIIRAMVKLPAAYCVRNTVH